jgi:hypothetical protein
MKNFVAFFMLLPLLACDKLPSSMSPEADLGKIERRWNDGLKLTAATPKIALSNQVGNLQAIKRDLEDLNIMGCLREPKGILVEHMDSVIDGMLAWMRDEKILSDSKQQSAEERATAYRTARDKCTRT